VTGITSDGISADLINAGTVNTNNINIMNADEPVFKWDSYGISAFYGEWANSEIGTTISAIDTKKIVRFDKHGIYGINNAGVDGEKWKPSSINDIGNKATFALTWDGLKIKNSKGITLRLGDGAKGADDDTDLLVVNNNSGDKIFAITENGSLLWSPSSTPAKTLYARTLINKPNKSYDSYDNDSDTDWHKI
jgi:hypothetical protein